MALDAGRSGGGGVTYQPTNVWKDKPNQATIVDMMKMISGLHQLSKFYFHIDYTRPNNVKLLHDQYSTSDYKSDIERMFFYSENITIPNRGINTEAHTYANGFRFESPAGTSYGDGDISISMHLDKNYIFHEFFMNWMDLIHNRNTGYFSFHNTYVADIEIYQLNAFGVDVSNSRYASQVFANLIATEGKNFWVYKVKLSNCYPKSVSAIEFNHSAREERSKINVGFTYEKIEYERNTGRTAPVPLGTAVFAGSVPNNLILPNMTAEAPMQEDFLPDLVPDANTTLKGFYTFEDDDELRGISQAEVMAAEARRIEAVKEQEKQRVLREVGGLVTRAAIVVHEERMDQALGNGTTFLQKNLSDIYGVTSPNPNYQDEGTQEDSLRESESEAFRRIYEKLGLEEPSFMPGQDGYLTETVGDEDILGEGGDSVKTPIDELRNKLVDDLLLKTTPEKLKEALSGDGVRGDVSISRNSVFSIAKGGEDLIEVDRVYSSDVDPNERGQHIYYTDKKNGKEVNVIIPIEEGVLGLDRQGDAALYEDMQKGVRQKNVWHGFLEDFEAQRIQKLNDVKQYHESAQEKILEQSGVDSPEEIQNPVMKAVYDRLDYPEELTIDQVNTIDHVAKQELGVSIMEPDAISELAHDTTPPLEPVVQPMTQEEFYAAAEREATKIDNSGLYLDENQDFYRNQLDEKLLNAISVDQAKKQKLEQKLKLTNTPIRNEVRKELEEIAKIRPLTDGEQATLDVANNPTMPDTTVTYFRDQYKHENAEQLDDFYLTPGADGKTKQGPYSETVQDFYYPERYPNPLTLQEYLEEQGTPTRTTGPLKNAASNVTGQASAKVMVMMAEKYGSKDAQGNLTLSGIGPEIQEDLILLQLGNPTWSQIIELEKKHSN